MDESSIINRHAGAFLAQIDCVLDYSVIATMFKYYAGLNTL